MESIFLAQLFPLFKRLGMANALESGWKKGSGKGRRGEGERQKEM